MLSLLNSTGCVGCTSGCEAVIKDYKSSGRIEYGVFVGYYSESDESDYESITEESIEKKSEVISEGDSEELDDVLEEGESNVIRDMFNETSSDGKCTLEQTSHLAHRIGLAPSKSDIDRLKSESGDNISFEDFERWITSITHPEDHVDYMVAYFQKYDLNRTGKISRKQFIWLTSIDGDILTKEEAEAILDKLCIKDDVDYEDLLSKIMSLEAKDKPMVSIGNRNSSPKKIPSNKTLVSQVSTTIRELADNEAFLPSIDLLEALRSTYGNELTQEAANETAKCCENQEEAAKYLLLFYSEWAKNKGMVTRKVVRDLLMVWKAKLDRVSAEAWITSLCGTDETINIQRVLNNVVNQASEDLN